MKAGDLPVLPMLSVQASAGPNMDVSSRSNEALSAPQPNETLVAHKSLDEFALFGGTAAFSRKLHVGQPNPVDRARFLQRVEQILDAKWYSNNGACVQELEAQLSRVLGVKHCVAVCNATVGLQIAARAIDLRGEVIVPSMTFVATPHALQWQGIKPVFCDVDARTHVLDPDAVRRLITDKTSGILGVHLWGRACPVEALQEIADEHGLQLIFDAAHAFGCTYGGRMIGNFGRAEVFSFHATKFFNTAEGGAITTNDDELAARLRAMVNFGFTATDEVGHLGTNGKMNEFSAAMGLASLPSLDEFVAVNHRNHDAYRRGLAQMPGVVLHEAPAAELSNFQYVVIEYTAPEEGPTRDEVVKVMNAENVMARRYFWPGCHRMEPYRSQDPSAAARLPRTEALAEKLIALPTGAGVSESDIEVVCELLRVVVSGGEVLRARLG